MWHHMCSVVRMVHATIAATNMDGWMAYVDFHQRQNKICPSHEPHSHTTTLPLPPSLPLFLLVMWWFHLVRTNSFSSTEVSQHDHHNAHAFAQLSTKQCPCVSATCMASFHQPHLSQQQQHAASSRTLPDQQHGRTRSSGCVNIASPSVDAVGWRTCSHWSACPSGLNPGFSWVVRMRACGNVEESVVERKKIFRLFCHTKQNSQTEQGVQT